MPIISCTRSQIAACQIEGSDMIILFVRECLISYRGSRAVAEL